MLTAVIIAAAVVAVAAALFVWRGRSGSGGPALKRRFGPEYHRAVARHEGDTKAAERELRERVRRHGSLAKRPLPPGAREQYEVQWAGIQRHFVDSPRQAVAETDALLAQVARERGFPDGRRFDEQVAAISVHHAEQAHGYRTVHAVARGQGGTEDMRKALIEARDLFEVLVTERPADPGLERKRSPGHRGVRVPWSHGRGHAKGSGPS